MHASSLFRSLCAWTIVAGNVLISNTFADSSMNGDGISTTGYIYSDGLVSASTFKGDGSQLTNLPIVSGAGDKLTSGTLKVTTNSTTSVVSLSTAGTTWGYLASAASYLPNLSSNMVSSTNISATALTVNGVSINGAGTSDRIVSGSHVFYVDGLGNTIDDISGTGKLSLSGNGSKNLEIGASRTDNNFAYIDLTGDPTYSDFGLRIIRANTGANAPSWIQSRGTGGLFIFTYEPAPIVFSTSSTERMRINSSGNVGIGTTNPNAKLTVNSSGSDEASISLRNNAGNYYTLWNDNGSSLLNFQYGGVTKMVMNSSGNVGIGTTNPGTALEVSGTISATNISATSLTVNGVAVTGGGGGGSGVPSGAVMSFAMSSCPTGWLKANGAAVSRVTYASLFTAIGTTFGTGDGSTTFNVPELRGEFIRGLDDARGIDASRALGSAQSSQNLAHTHTGTADSAGAHTHSESGSVTSSPAYNGGSPGSSGPRFGTTTTGSAGAHTHTLTINSDGGTEARPRNIALLYCIKQ